MNHDRAVEIALRGKTTASEGVLDALAAAERTDPVDLTPPLYSVVDPEALDAFVGSLRGSEGRIEFVYREYLVTVDGAGGVRVRSRRSEGDEGV